MASFPPKPGVDRPAPLNIDTFALIAALPGIEHAAPLILYSTHIHHQGRSAEANIVGATVDLSGALDLRLDKGRFMSRYDSKATCAVAGNRVVQELALQVGSRVRVDEYLFEIVGIIKNQPRNPLIPVNVDDAIMIPIAGMRRVIPSPEISNIVARTSETEADCATQELSLEESINQLDAARLELLRLLALDSNTRITVTDPPIAQRTEIGLSTALSAAFEHRPSYLAKIVSSEQAAINLEVARNEQLWDISLIGEARQFRTRLPVAGSDNRSWDRYAGVQVDIPLGDLSRKQSEIQASVEAKNQGIALADARQALELEVDNAVRNLGVRWRQYEIAQRARDLSRQKLEVEREKLRRGAPAIFRCSVSRRTCAMPRAPASMRWSLISTPRAHWTMPWARR